jgi:hypothetical protein
MRVITDYLKGQLTALGYSDAEIGWTINYCQGDYVGVEKAKLDFETLLRRLVLPNSISAFTTLTYAIENDLVSVWPVNSFRSTMAVDWDVLDGAPPNLEGLVKDFIRAIESDLEDWSTEAYRLLSDAFMSAYSREPEQQAFRRTSIEVLFTAMTCDEISDAFMAFEDDIDSGADDYINDALHELAEDRWVIRDLMCEIYELDDEGERHDEPVASIKWYAQMFPAGDRSLGGARREMFHEALEEAGLTRDERRKTSASREAA